MKGLISMSSSLTQIAKDFVFMSPSPARDQLEQHIVGQLEAALLHAQQVQRDAFEPYLRHAKECEPSVDAGYHCTCGLATLRSPEITK